MPAAPGELMVVRYRPQYRWWRRLILLFAAGVAGMAGFLVGQSVQRPTMDEALDSVRDVSRQLAMHEQNRAMDQQALLRSRQSLTELEEQLASLRAETLFYKSILQPAVGEEGVQIQRFEISALSPGTYRYRLMLVQAGDNKTDARGLVRLEWAAPDLRGKAHHQVLHPEAPRGISFQFRYFQEVTGSFALPEGVVPVRIRLDLHVEEGRALVSEQEFDWATLTEMTSHAAFDTME